MRIEWVNNGEPNEDGDIVAHIMSAKGKPTSTFKGKSYREVADKVLEAQVAANIRFSTNRKPDQGVKPVKAEPKQLTTDDKFRLSQEITDPNKVVDAVTEIMTAKQGLPPEKVGEAITDTTVRQSDEFYRQEADAFMKANPSYYPVPQNRDKLIEVLKLNNWDMTRNNLSLAYDALLEQGEMIPWPSDKPDDDDEGNGPPVGPNGSAPVAMLPANAPAPRPRSVSTGIRRGDASSLLPSPPKPKKYTRADIERMSRADYLSKLLNEPGFKATVDAMGA